MKTISLTLALTLFAGCSYEVRGDGVAATDKRALIGFDSVEVSSVIDATLTPGPWLPLVLTGDRNIVSLIETEVSGGRLVVRLPEDYSIEPVLPLRLTLTLPALVGVGASGASSVTAEVTPCDQFTANASGASLVNLTGLASGSLDADASGSSKIELAGRSDLTQLNLSGSAQILTHSVVAADVVVNASGSSRAEVQASRSVSGDLSGSSSVRVWGQPADREIQTSGSAQIRYQ